MGGVDEREVVRIRRSGVRRAEVGAVEKKDDVSDPEAPRELRVTTSDSS